MLQLSRWLVLVEKHDTWPWRAGDKDLPISESTATPPARMSALKLSIAVRMFAFSTSAYPEPGTACKDNNPEWLWATLFSNLDPPIYIPRYGDMERASKVSEDRCSSPIERQAWGVQELKSWKTDFSKTSQALCLT